MPAELTVASAATPAGEAFHVGQMYTAFARAIRGGESRQPDFATAVETHRLIDAIQHAADSRREVETSA